MAQVTALSPRATPGKPYSFSAKPAAGLTVILRIQFGDSVLLSSGAIAAPSSASDVPFEISGLLIVRSIGTATTTLSASGRYDNGQTSGLLGPTTEVSGAADSTVENVVQATVQWGAASASNTITVQNILIEKYDPA